MPEPFLFCGHVFWRPDNHTKTNERMKTTSKTRSTRSKSTASQNRDDLATQLGKLFEDELKDIYWAEKALTKALPKMIKKATSEELIEALEDHLAETEQHVTRAEEIFSLLGKEPKAKKCEAMAGLIKEAEGIMEDSEAGVMRDAGIISAAQKVEHYEIASYGTLRTFAQTLGFDEAASILETTLEEEKTADSILTDIATSAINLEAAEEPAS
jgi:ferritin-like metal-binding protein YciE